MSRDYPELNGRCVQLPGDAAIYLVDQGKRRHVPDPNTFNNLFRSWRIDADPNLDDINLGTQITDGAILAQAFGDAAVYLLDSGVKRHVSDPATMDKYNFSWNTIQHMSAVAINSIATPAGASATIT